MSNDKAINGIRELLNDEGADILETILTEAATAAVKDRVGAAYRAIYKGKFVPFDEKRPYDMDELQEAMTFLLDPDARVRAFSDRDNREAREATGCWTDPAMSGADTREVVSDDNMAVIIEDSERLLKAIAIESFLTDCGVEAQTTSQEELDGWNNWRRDRIARNIREDHLNKEANAKRSKEAVTKMAATLAKLK